MVQARRSAWPWVVTVCAALLTGCTSASAVVTQTVSSPEAASSNVLSAAPAMTNRSSPGTSSPPATTAASIPWPADLTKDQVAAAESALAAVAGYVKVTAAANADPSAKDWTADVRTYAADPLATQTLEALGTLTKAKVHQTVSPVYEHPTVISVDDHRTVVEACLNDTKTTLVDAAGRSALGPAASPRAVVTLTLRNYAPKVGGWLIGEQLVSSPARKC